VAIVSQEPVLYARSIRCAQCSTNARLLFPVALFPRRLLHSRTAKGGGCCLACVCAGSSGALPNRMHLVLFGMQNRTFGPYLAGNSAVPEGV
jgi:hypothetical protein